MKPLTLELWLEERSWLASVTGGYREEKYGQLLCDASNPLDAQSRLEGMIGVSSLEWTTLRSGDLDDIPHWSAIALVEESFDVSLVGLRPLDSEKGERMRELAGIQKSKAAGQSSNRRGVGGASPQPSRHTLQEQHLMGFEIYTPSTGLRGVRPGKASVNKSGCVTLSATDIHKASINGRAVILLDIEGQRIGLSKPEDTGETRPTLNVKRNKSNTAASLNLKGALQALDFDFSKGPIRKRVVIENKMLIVTLKD